MPSIRIHKLGTIVRSALAIAPVSIFHHLAVFTIRCCLLALGTICLNHISPKAGLSSYRKKSMRIGLRVSPTGSVRLKPAKTLPRRPRTCQQRRARGCPAILSRSTIDRLVLTAPLGQTRHSISLVKKTLVPSFAKLSQTKSHISECLWF